MNFVYLQIFRGGEEKSSASGPESDSVGVCECVSACAEEGDSFVIPCRLMSGRSSLRAPFGLVAEMKPTSCVLLLAW